MAVAALMLALPLISQAAPPGVTKAADLFAGKTTDVGDVFVWNDATNYYVEINMDDGWCMTESHVIVAATVAGIPQANGNPIPGQFPAGEDYNPCADGDTFTFAIAGVGAHPYVAVHVKAWEEVVSTATIVSDPGTSNPVSYASVYPTFGAAVPAVVPTFAASGTWPAISGASYVSNQLAGDPFGMNAWRMTSETLTVPGWPLGGQLWVNSDNYELTRLNGVEIQRDDNGPVATVENAVAEPAVSPQTWSTIENVAFMPNAGANVFTFVFRNSTWDGGGSFVDNPTGLIYKASATYYAHSESAWAGTAVGVTAFGGKNWATYFQVDFEPVLIQTLTVPTGSTAGIDSSLLAAGKSFEFMVTGTTTWLNRGGVDVVDAECVNTNGGGWLDTVIDFPQGGDELLELQVNAVTREWVAANTASSEGCDSLNEYTLPFVGTGAAVNFRIFDGLAGVQDPSWYTDNSGTLTVQIWQTAP
jgi:hypothetical protein